MAHTDGAAAGPVLSSLSLPLLRRTQAFSPLTSVRSTPAGAGELNALEIKQSKTEALCFYGLTLQVQMTSYKESRIAVAGKG